jgi:hypothetical protein
MERQSFLSGLNIKKHPWMIFLMVIILIAAWLFLSNMPVQAGAAYQIPTGTVLTVTGTPSGPIVTVKLDINQDQINVRAGPSTTYDKVGVLLLGQTAVAKGRSKGGDWIMIVYPGVPGGVAWINSPLVDITPGELPVVDPPPTPTPLVTITIDPTMAAQFVVTQAPTRLPTFTPPPPLAIPTFVADPVSESPAGVPMGIVILGLAAVGIFLGLFALAQGR